MTKYKAIIFDLDGTLIDSREGVLSAVIDTIRQLNLMMPSEEILEGFVGPPMQDSFRINYEMGKEDALKAANLFRKNYKEKSLFRAKLYDGVLETMGAARDNGYQLAVATNKSHENAMKILDYFGISKFCDYAKGSDLEGRLSKSDILKECLVNLECLSSEGVFVGDSDIDLRGSEQVGVDFIAATYGYGFQKGESICSKSLIGTIDVFSDLMGVLG